MLKKDILDSLETLRQMIVIDYYTGTERDCGSVFFTTGLR